MQRFRFPRAFVATLALAAVAFPSTAEDGLIGGPDIVPINPDFSPQVPLESEVGVGFLSGSSLFSFSPQIMTTLGAAVAQSVSASNRPSVLTPYSGEVNVMRDGQLERTEDSFGSFVTNKASTIGRGNFSFGFSYQHQKFDKFDGQSIGDYITEVDDQTFAPDALDSSDLNDIALPPGLLVNLIPIEGFDENGDFVFGENFRAQTTVRVRDLEITADVITLSLTYGLLDRLDVGAIVPYIFLNSKGTAEVRVTVPEQNGLVVIGPDGNDDGVVDTIQTLDFATIGANSRFKGKFDRDFEGFGDIVLFAKYHLLSQNGSAPDTLGTLVPQAMPLDLAFQFEVKAPTGDEDEFLGTGEWDFAGRMILQRQWELLGRPARVRGEIGYNRSGLGADFSSFEYKVGGEIVPFQAVDLAMSAEVIGRETNAFYSQVDGVVGAKYSPGQQIPALENMAIFGGLRFPFTQNGLTSPISPIVGVEYTFKRRSAEVAPPPPPADFLSEDPAGDAEVPGDAPPPAETPLEEGAPAPAESEASPVSSAPAPALGKEFLAPPKAESAPSLAYRWDR